jgi:hypothetical protein
MGTKLLYNGANMCHSKDCCPVIEQQPDGTIIVHDPAKPESGWFTMSTDELRSMLAKSPEILAQLSA